MIARAALALAALLFALPVVATWQPGVPVSLRLASLAILVTGWLRPAWAVAMVAGLVLLSMPVSVLSGAPFGGAETMQVLVVPLLASGAAKMAIAGRPLQSRLLLPASALAVVLLGVAAVQLLAGGEARDAGGRLPVEWLRFMAGGLFLEPGRFVPIHDVMLWMQALGLAVVVEQVLRSEPAARQPVLRMMAAGVTGAAAFAIYRLIEVSLRTPVPVATAWDVLRTVRFNPHFADLNAAGSLYVLFFVPLVWWTLAGRRAWLIAPSAATGLALWTTGSRSALAAAVIGLGFAWAIAARPSWRRLALAALLVVPLAWIATRDPGRGGATEAQALSIRAGLFRAGLAVAQRDPLFGLGFRSFPSASSSALPAGLVEAYPGLARGENAHNNFMQILVEFGGLGLAAFLWLVVTACEPFAAEVRAGTAGPVVTGLAAGLLAFLVSCLGGHPLLIPQVLVPFGFALGLVAGTPARVPSRSRRFERWAAGGLAGLVLISIPFRVAGGS